jgi:hypothetical protein
MGDKGSDVPEQPNLKPIETRWKRSTKMAQRLAAKHRQWAQRQNKRNWKRNTPIIKNLRTMMEDQMANAAEDRARYEDVFVPYEDQYMEEIEGLQGKADAFSASVDKLKADALEYGSEANKRFKMGQAQAGVSTAFDAAKQNSLRTLESAGVDPSATRYAALTYGLDTAKAAAQAGAGTQMGMDVDETARAMFSEALDRELQARGLDKDIMGMRSEVVGRGRDLAGQAVAENIAGADMGTKAVTGQLATSDLANKQRVSTNEFLRTLNEGLSGWGDMLNTSYSNAVDAYTAEQQSSSGVGGVLGTILGGIRGFVAEGGEIPEEWSPTDGAAEDDVPTMLTAGEFVFPKEAVDFYGADRLYKMRDKAIQGMADFAAADEAEQEAIPTELALSTTAAGDSGSGLSVRTVDTRPGGWTGQARDMSNPAQLGHEIIKIEQDPRPYIRRSWEGR